MNKYRRDTKRKREEKEIQKREEGKRTILTSDRQGFLLQRQHSSAAFGVVLLSEHYISVIPLSLLSPTESLFLSPLLPVSSF